MLADRTQATECYKSDKVGNIELNLLGVVDLFKFNEVRTAAL